MAKTTVQNTQISFIKVNEEDHVSLTDMLKAKDGDFFFSNWLGNLNTIKRIARRAALTLLLAVMTVAAWATDGIITGDGGASYFTVTGGTGGTKAEEDYDKLMDGTADTKWCITSFSGCYIEFQADNAFIPTGYILTTGNDTKNNSGRNPKNWVLKAKKNFADDWTTLATVTNDGVLQAANKTSYEFALSNTENYYRYFRFEVSAIKGGSTFQLGELQIRGRDKMTSWKPGFDPAQWIQDVMLVGGSQSEVNAKIATYQSQGWTWNEQNLNAGNNGDVIYLLYKLGSTASPSHTFITQIYISDASGDASGSFIYQGFRYKLAAYDGSESFKASKGNLNNGVSGGDRIHLYYTTEHRDKAISHIIFNKTQSGAQGKNGGDSEGYDLNNPGKGDKIYMHCLSDDAPTWFVEKNTDGSLCYVKGYNQGTVTNSDIFAFPAIIDGAAVLGISVNFYNFENLEAIYFSEAYNASTIPSAGNKVTKLKHVHIVDNSGAVVKADELPASVTSLDNSPFAATAIETLKMPNVRSIANYAFLNCHALTSVTMPNVTSIGYKAFNGCDALTSVTFPSGLTSIGERAFYGCNALTSISLPSSVTSIAKEAFDGCYHLTSATIHGNPTMGYMAFCDATELKLRPRTKTCGGASWTTFYNDRFNYKAQGVAKVYKATVSGGQVGLTEVKDKIVPEGTAVVLKTGESNTYVQLNRTKDASTDTQHNDLHGVNAPTNILDMQAGNYAGCTFYVLSYTDGVGYYRYSGDMMPQNEAFLTLPPGAATPQMMPVVEVETLSGNSSNSATLSAWAADGKTRNVMLSGRKLWKDGEWNTLCLPFAMTEEQVTAQLAPARLMTLSTSSFNGGTLTLNFENATTIEAGKPYIVKWTAGGANIENPIFTGVTVSNTTAIVETPCVDFIGITSPVTLAANDRNQLYLDIGNTLCHPGNAITLNAFHAWFQLGKDLVVSSLGDVNGDKSINVTDVTFLVNNILGNQDDHFIIDNADVSGDGTITVTDVTSLVNVILNGSHQNILNVVINGADGLTFSDGGSGPARITRK